LMTFENPAYAVTEERAKQIKTRLEEDGIYWYPTSYHPGISLRAKALDNYNGIAAGLKIWYRHRPQIIHSRSSLPTAIAVIIAKLSRSIFLYDADSVLSEEYADIEHWARKSKGFRITAASEALARKAAKQIIVLTDTLRQDFIKDFQITTPIEVIPCCVDLDKFNFNVETRKRKRAELNLSEEKLFVYVGKIGSWYLVNETFDFFKEVQKNMSTAKLLVVTQDPPGAFHQLALSKNISKDSYFIKKASHTEVPEWLSASDVGLALIKSLKSKRGSSPVKVAEYLASGLPVVITDKIGDCSNLIIKNKIGAVVKQTNYKGYHDTVIKLNELWSENSSAVTLRCKVTAEKNFSLKGVGIKRYQYIYKKMLS
jgi:glycosyltransferase involved in cell wall biosynthesis